MPVFLQWQTRHTIQTVLKNSTCSTASPRVAHTLAAPLCDLQPACHCVTDVASCVTRLAPAPPPSMHRPHSAHWRLAGLLVLLFACTAAPAQESAWRAHSKCCTWRGNSLPDCAGCLEPNTPLQLGGEGSTLTHRLHFPAVWATWLQFQHKPVTFEVQPCWGEASLHLGRGDPVDLDTEHLNVSATGGTASLSIPWNHVHYYVDVQRSAGAVVNISVLLPGEHHRVRHVTPPLLATPLAAAWRCPAHRP